MFDVYCTGHQARVLLGSRSVDRLVSTPEGVELHWHCRCGTTGVLHTGRHRGAALGRGAEQAAA